jgi:hypothetical protein
MKILIFLVLLICNALCMATSEGNELRTYAWSTEVIEVGAYSLPGQPTVDKATRFTNRIVPTRAARPPGDFVFVTALRGNLYDADSGGEIGPNDFERELVLLHHSQFDPRANEHFEQYGIEHGQLNHTVEFPEGTGLLLRDNMPAQYDWLPVVDVRNLNRVPRRVRFEWTFTYRSFEPGTDQNLSMFFGGFFTLRYNRAHNRNGITCAVLKTPKRHLPLRIPSVAVHVHEDWLTIRLTAKATSTGESEVLLDLDVERDGFDAAFRYHDIDWHWRAPLNQFRFHVCVNNTLQMYNDHTMLLVRSTAIWPRQQRPYGFDLFSSTPSNHATCEYPLENVWRKCDLRQQ